MKTGLKHARNLTHKLQNAGQNSEGCCLHLIWLILLNTNRLFGMKDTIEELEQIVETYSKKIAAISEEEFSAKPQPDKWSKKEVLGHLIDSAHNNARRFIVGQYDAAPPRIVYDQDQWVSLNNYQQTDGKEIIALWALANKRIVSILKKMPASAYSKQADTGKSTPSLHTLEFLAVDYVKHLKHHLNQIIPHSSDVVYP